MDLGSCYEDRYLPASFNGIQFRALEASSEHGRRGAEGEFPFGENTGYVDLGRKIRRYTLRGRLDGNDHLTRATLLAAACEVPGPGILVHPTRGVVNAACVSLTLTDEPVEGQGVTSIEMQLVEGELWNNAFGLVGSLLGLVVRPLVESCADQFRVRYRVRNEYVYLQPGVLSIAKGTAQRFSEEYSRTTSPDPRVSSDLNRVSQDDDQASDVSVMETVIRNGSATLSQKLTFDNSYEAFRRIANWSSAQSDPTDSGGILLSFLRTVSGAYMAQAAVQRTYGSTEQALMVMDQVLTVLREESQIFFRNCDNPPFLAINSFIDEFIVHMNRIAYGSPARIDYDFNGVVSPIQAAYAIWDDATRSREVQSSNFLQPRGFVGPTVGAVPGG